MTEATALERAAALEAVVAASRLCRAAQGRLSDGQMLTKSDDSPVTVADFAAQVVVADVLSGHLGGIDLVGEEQPDDLVDRPELLRAVGGLVGGETGAGPGPDRVLDLLSVGGGAGSSERWWTLDPIDGTKGFLRGDQYAIALALVVDGEVALGVLGCPNLPVGDGAGDTGAVFVAGGGRCEQHPLDGGPVRTVAVSPPAPLSAARVCESVESAHSDHGVSAAVVERLGIEVEPFRIDSQCKYAAVARGDASIYLRLPTRPGRREKIWDHAAGKYVVEQAGGRVTDIAGRPLDFRHGSTLARNHGVVATDGAHHDEVLAAIATVADRLPAD